jgi:thymidylate kinase
MPRLRAAPGSAVASRRLGAFVVLVGPDGVGKTTVARALTEQYDGPTAYFHFRPSLFRALTSRPPDGTETPMSKEARGGSRVAGWLRLIRTVIHCRLAYLVRVRPALQAGTLVIADRWAYGYLVHPRALRFHGPAWLATLAVRALPRPHVIANLRASPALIRERKRELSLEQLEAELAAWACLPASRLATFDADEAPATIARRILRELQTMTLRRERYTSFPPGQRFFRVPTSSRHAALAGLSLYPSCRPRALWGQRAAWMAVTLCGPRVLFGRSAPWRPSIDPGVWAELCAMWCARLGPFDSMAVYERRQASRPGLALLLLHRGIPVAFVKMRASGTESLCEEAGAHTAAWKARPRSFFVPEPLLSGTIGGWDYFAIAPLPPRIHYPPDDPPVDAILSEVEGALADLHRPSDVPVHWRPMHGDFAPWNLRRVEGGGLVLIDWERAGWGPPSADRVLYRATEAVLRGTMTEPTGALEAIRFWQWQVANRPESDIDHAFTRALQARLRAMEQRG